MNASTIITSHNNADFDALASIIAAGKLYPGAVLVFPGSQERNLRNFFIQSATYMFNFRNARDVDPIGVDTLVVVDTRQRSRLSHIEHLLDKPGLEIHAYDHHPDSDDDLVHTRGEVRPAGSTTTILAGKLMARDTVLEPDEATILGLGLFEDTGSFTFPSTTEEDFRVGAWLRSQGMDLVVIGDLLSHELNAEQVTLLNDLLESATTHEINGVRVVMTEATLDRYVSDFALLAHKMLDMENIRVLFAMGLMLDRVHVVARSRTPDVDVGRICAALGGGGHPYAASATIRDRTMAQVKEELFALLYSHINPQRMVKDLMTGPAIAAETGSTLAEAGQLMSRLHLKAMPVNDAATGKFAGLLEYRTAANALSHGLGHMAVGEYMQRDCAMLSPDADLYEAMEIIVGQRQRLAPVVVDNRVIGVVTRTDLINALIEEPARIPETLLPEKNRERSVRSMLHERLPKDVFLLLRRAGELAEEMGYALYAVGGFVRDILLRRPNLDLDLVVEGDAIRFADALARELGGRIRSHHKFKTAVVIHGSGQHIDVATARLEYYEYPAALPTVELSSIKMDLYRRDFTINALAAQLNPGQFGKLVDFFGAQRDIKDRVIRVLHSLSFVEDPTRILRAIRFEQRYDFKLGAQTERLIGNAMQLGLIHKLSGARLFNELRQIMEENNPPACLRRMERFHIPQTIHPVLEISPAKEHLLQEAERVLNWYRLLYLEPAPTAWQVYLLVLCNDCTHEEAEAVARRLGFSKRVEREFLAVNSQVKIVAEQLMPWGRKKAGPVSGAHAVLRTLPVEGVLYLMARTRRESIRKLISLHLTSVRNIRIEITGTDLVKTLHIPPGPRIGEILRAVLDARIDDLAPDRKSQLALARRLAGQE